MIIAWRIPARILQIVSVGSALIHVWTCTLAEPAGQGIVVRRGDAVDLMPTPQVAEAHFSGMKSGINRKADEFQPLKR